MAYDVVTRHVDRNPERVNDHGNEKATGKEPLIIDDIAHFMARLLLSKTTTHLKTSTGETGRQTAPEIVSKMPRIPILTNTLLYTLPVGAVLAITIICGATIAQTANLGGVRILWLFIWIEVVWMNLWISHATVNVLPFLFQRLFGMFNPGWRDYGLAAKALQSPLGLLGWTLCSLATFAPVNKLIAFCAGR